jgi:hypothetical protein
MTMRLTRDAYAQIILQDMQWLFRQPRSLERDHIAGVLRVEQICSRDTASRLWSELDSQRDANGEFTPLAMALQALSDHGCDCGTDEPGTCLACVCEAALKDLWIALKEHSSRG